MGKLRRAIVDTALITPSGALSPGPLSASAIAAGAGLGVLGGLLTAVGHLVVEVPYFVALVVLSEIIEERLGRVRVFLDLFAAGFMVFFAVLLVESGVALLGGEGFSPGSIISSPITALFNGIVLTGANAYFLAWWFTVGKPIVDSARELGWRGGGIVYAVHYSYDLVWLVALSMLGGIIASTGAGYLAGLMFVLAAILLYFGYKMISPYLSRMG
ncbi:MAG: LysE family translocator [Desulfurococcales archaeon]|nr:LysE family translocator [Desulfurococcales archaeon]